MVHEQVRRVAEVVQGVVHRGNGSGLLLGVRRWRGRRRGRRRRGTVRRMLLRRRRSSRGRLLGRAPSLLLLLLLALAMLRLLVALRAGAAAHRPVARDAGHPDVAAAVRLRRGSSPSSLRGATAATFPPCLPKLERPTTTLPRCPFHPSTSPYSFQNVYCRRDRSPARVQARHQGAVSRARCRWSAALDRTSSRGLTASRCSATGTSWDQVYECVRLLCACC